MAWEPAGGTRDEDQHQGTENDQDDDGDDDALGHVLLGVGRFLGGQRNTLDGQEEPDAVDQGGQDPADAHGQESAGSDGAVRDDVKEFGGVELRQQPDDDRNEGDDGHRGDREHDLERLADAAEMDADEEHIGNQVHGPGIGQAEQPQRLDVTADERGDGRRRDGVFDQDGDAGGVAAERSRARRAKA